MAALPFMHSRLDTTNPRAFRILELLPSWNLKGPIQCEIHHRTLDDDVHYEALSYAWGEPEPKSSILINRSGVLGVTRNCYDALYHLRWRFCRRFLWVDAICIDQHGNDESTRERNHQVKFMRDIYAKAERVLIWLGCAVPGTTLTMMRLKLNGWMLDGAIPRKPVASPCRGYMHEDTRGLARVEESSEHPSAVGMRGSAWEDIGMILLVGMSKHIP